MLKVESKLNIYFALMACFCGLTFFGTPELGGLPFIAIFFALFGLIFVDLLRWFALPATMAYVALGAIAFYTINRFLTIGALAAEPQMIAVAELLVLVQSVLMLQRKNRRIYEQLAVFALLELIVAAIFNHAVSYGVLLLPLGAAAIGALSLLHIYSTTEEAFTRRESAGSTLRVSSIESKQSFVEMASPLPRLGFLTIAPAVSVVALVFFYALPRTNHESRRNSGKAQVGFNSEVQLGQIGKMMLNPEIAARIQIQNRRTGLRYDVVGGLYVRGAVLETYDHRDGTWFMSEEDAVMAPRQLPPSPMGGALRRRTFNDELAIKFNIAPMRSESLFSLPPYFFDATGPDVQHNSDRWILSRRKRNLIGRDSQTSYRIASLGFRDGMQQQFIPRFAPDEVVGPETPSEQDASETRSEPIAAETQSEMIAEGASEEPQPAQDDKPAVSNSGESIADSIKDLLSGRISGTLADNDPSFAEAERQDREVSALNYVDACLQYDAEIVPTAKEVADGVVQRMPKETENPVEVARAIEAFLKGESAYEYSLNLTNEEIVGIDPIEQFLSIDRSGNCQYFASAMVLMLRSQGIPARLVVGFNTDEYNNITGQYVARQSHAHAWVEAMVDAKWVKPREAFYSDTPSEHYWMRLDPTPGGSANRAAASRVSEVLDMAQDIWSSYVVDADGSGRRRDMGNGNNQISSTYEMYYEWIKLKFSRIRAGELGAGSLAGRELFSWPSALVGILVSIAVVAAYQFGIPRLTDRRRGDTRPELATAAPSIDFYAETMALLERVGLRRRRGQTPKEFTVNAAQTLAGAQPSLLLSNALSVLTAAYYRARFATNPQIESGLPVRDENIELALSEVRKEIDHRLERQASETPSTPNLGGSIKPRDMR